VFSFSRGVFAGGPEFDLLTSAATGAVTKAAEVNDPISASNGAYFFTKPLLFLGGPMGFRADLLYRSSHGGGFPLPRGFLLNLFSFADTALLNGTLYATVWLGTGDQVAFKKVSGNWILTGPTETLWGTTFVDQRPQRKYVFKETTNYAYLLDPIAEEVYIFYKYQIIGGGQWIGRIARIMDRNGNQLIYTYPSADAENPSRIDDGLGRILNLVYTQVGFSTFLSTITDQGGRIVRFNYEEHGTDNFNNPTLRSVTDPMTQTTTFQYAGFFSNLIASQTLPRTNTPYTQLYESEPFYTDTDIFPRVTRQTDAYNNQTTLSYDNTNHILDVTYPDGTTQKYKHHSTYGFPEYITDRASKTIQFTRNADEEHITGMTDKNGDTTSFTYHTETGKLASLTNAKGNTLTYTYTAQEQTFTNPLLLTEQVTFTFYNLTRIDYPDGTNEQFTYDAKGNMLTHIDQAGKTWTYTYNGKGQLLTIANPAGGMITHTYNNDGTLASSMDSDTGITAYAYDTYKRLNKITNPDTTFIQIAYDLNDQVTSITDENNHTYTYEYDADGNLTKITDPALKQTQYAYDLMDRVNQVTNRLGKISTLAYSNMGRLQSVTDPNNLTTSFGYDSRGWLNAITLGGQSWQTGYDDEGIVLSRKTPLNHTTTYQSDKLGFITGITNPLNQTTTLTRDALSRITGITDPLNRSTTYAYDSRGLLSGVTLPVIGTATYTRNDQGLLSQITDLIGSHWASGYTSVGRLQSQTDPLGNIWQYSYDNRGRRSGATFPEGGTVTRTYDAAGNITRLLYSGGPDLQFTYDTLNRLLTANNLTLTRDAEGRVTNTENPGTSFGTTYDDGGRLKTVTDNNGAFTVTYTYDATTALLSRVTDSLTGAQIDFIYDSDRRMTGINRSNNVNTTLTWDNANRLTGIKDVGANSGSPLLDLQYTLDAAGQVTKAKITVPLDPATLLEQGTDSFTYNAASEVSASGYSYDQRGRQTAGPGSTLSWDGASRLVGIGSTNLTYNGLGDLQTRTEGGQIFRYYYNYAIGLNPIMAEKNDSTAQLLRYYVWTPGGRLLYMIDAANSNKVYFYHFDFGGSTLALTDSTGAVTDKYAYDPVGELLGHQGNNQQPFTFLGRWGIRQECPSTGSGCGTLYHIRARYYDAVTQRFISRDPIWPPLGDPVQLNPYQYGGIDPINRLDITGGGEVLNDLWKYDATGKSWTALEPTALPPIRRKQRPQWVNVLMRELDQVVGQRESEWKETNSVLSNAIPSSKVLPKPEMGATPSPLYVPKTQETPYICVPGGIAPNYDVYCIGAKLPIVENRPPVATRDVLVAPTGDVLRAQKERLLANEYDPDDVNLFGFTVNSRTQAVDVSVFSFEPSILQER